MNNALPIAYLQLEADDNATSVRDRLAFLRGQRVLLVWPEVGSALQRKLDLVLVQREAMRQGVQVALVTHDAQVIRHARELDISAFETLQQGEGARRWRRGRARNFATRLKRPAPLDPEVLMPIASRVRGQAETPRARALRLAARGFVLLLLFGVLLAAAYLLVPSARVQIAVAQTWIEADALITADPTREQATVDAENGIIPATTVRAELEERGTLPTTGVRNTISTPAVGTITWVNRGENAITIAAGTLVSTSAGTPVVFRTTEAVELPAGVESQAEVPIEAIPESAGEVGNVEAGLINTVLGPLADQVDARNLSPTTGGSQSGQRVVSADDRDRLLATLRQQLQERAFRELATRIPETQVMIAESVRIDEERSDWTTFDREVGEAAEQVTLTMRAVVAVTAVDGTLAQSIAYARLGTQVEAGRAIEPNTLLYTRGSPTEIFANGTVTFLINARAMVRAQLDPVALQTSLAGQDIEDTAQTLSSLPYTVTTPTVDLQPAWWGSVFNRLPILPTRIRVDVVDTPLNTDAESQPAPLDVSAGVSPIALPEVTPDARP